MSLNNRLKRLEQVLGAAKNPYMDIPLPELLDKFEQAMELPAGSLPRTTDQAAALGYESIAHATAAALGMTLTEFKDWLNHEH
jgi:hypothetical protein